MCRSSNCPAAEPDETCLTSVYSTPPHRPIGSRALWYGLRHLLGRVFGWDDVGIETEYSLAGLLSERDRTESEVPAGTPDGPFRGCFTAFETSS